MFRKKKEFQIQINSKVVLPSLLQVKTCKIDMYAQCKYSRTVNSNHEAENHLTYFGYFEPYSDRTGEKIVHCFLKVVIITNLEQKQKSA